MQIPKKHRTRAFVFAKKISGRIAKKENISSSHNHAFTSGTGICLIAVASEFVVVNDNLKLLWQLQIKNDPVTL